MKRPTGETVRIGAGDGAYPAFVPSAVKELTGFKRNRVFAHAPYVELLSEGTEPIR